MSELVLKEYRKHHASNMDFNKPNSFNKEGEDHLNVCIQSSLKVGRILDPGYCYNFHYPHVGRFSSILSFLYWLKSSDRCDSIRTLRGSGLTRYIKDNGLKGKRLKNFKALVLKATWIRVNNRKDIVEEIMSLPDDLSIVSYFTDKVTGVRITTNYAKYVCEVANEVIRSIKEGREPDYDRFVSDDRQKKSTHFLTGNI